MNGHQGYYAVRGVRILGAALYLHWTAVLVAGIVLYVFKSQPLHGALAILCYFGIIVLHEFGHALFARQLGYRPTAIHLSAIHGTCTFEQPDTPKEEAAIAWGGVLLQLAVALPLIALDNAVQLGKLPYLGIVVGFLGYISVLVAATNLAPALQLDGERAWRLFPILAREARLRASAKKATKAVLRRVK
jgi:Zn-dependent protease